MCKQCVKFICNFTVFSYFFLAIPKKGWKLFLGMGFRYDFIYGFQCVPNIGLIAPKSRLIVHIFCNLVFFSMVLNAFKLTFRIV